MIPIRTLLACSLILASAAGFAADNSPQHVADDPSGAKLNKICLKLQRIIIPKLEFHDATVREVIDYLKKESARHDADSPAGSRGVNIVLRQKSSRDAGSQTARPHSVDNAANTRITVSRTNVRLFSALKYITDEADLKFQVEPDAVVIVSPSDLPVVPPGTLLTKEWKIPPDLIPRTPSTNKNERAAGPAKSWLIANGVAFNDGATAIYIEKTSRLIVRNTQDQLDLVDTIIHEGQGSGPVSVEIECQFVEIPEDDLKELKFDSFLNQFNTPMGKNAFISGGNVGSLVITPETLKKLEFQFPTKESFRVFTDPQIQTVWRALHQKKGVNMLSAPKMTVKSGQSMALDVIRALHHPLEDTPPQIPAALLSLAPPESRAALPGRPGEENRELDVALEVEPVVGPDGYTIDLNLSRQVMDCENDIGHGSPVVATIADPATGALVRRILTPRLHPVPVFSTRKETQMVSVYDGSTVVLDGLLRKDTPERVKDEDFFLGGVPFLIPPFPSSPDDHIPRRLFIFVTARLVNASGGPGPGGADEEKEPVIGPIAPPEVLPLMPK
ncbi:MAG: hypothetical protein P4L99_14670 [Chthoniobacter sp.]|nr:hypothetical protein [Chthoniobacter sp.]